MSKQSIIIIGAGAAGLMAAKELSSVFDVTMLEAQDRIGGRIHSITEQDCIIEAGAEFVHGNLPLTLALLKEAGISYEKVSGSMYRKKKAGFQSVEEMTEGWDELMEKMKGLKEDITMQELLDKYYDAPRYDMLRRHVKSYVEGFDIADLSRVSVQSLYQEWDAEEEDIYRIPQGYSSLIEYLQKKVQKSGCIIHLETIVQKVDWQQGTVTVHASNDQIYTASKLLVTVPVSVLQQPACKAYIHFNPSLHFDDSIARQIGFGAVIKVIIKFRKTFWQNDAGFILSDETVPTWWTQLPNEKPLLTGWLGGPKAKEFSNETDEAILNKALSSLASIYDMPVGELKKEVEWSRIFNWQKNDYAMGAYSYPTVQTVSAREQINQPLAGTIFSAGEALYKGPFPGTVEASLVSAIKTADIIKALAK